MQDYQTLTPFKAKHNHRQIHIVKVDHEDSVSTWILQVL